MNRQSHAYSRSADYQPFTYATPQAAQSTPAHVGTTFHVPARMAPRVRRPGPIMRRLYAVLIGLGI